MDAFTQMKTAAQDTFDQAPNVANFGNAYGASMAGGLFANYENGKQFIIDNIAKLQLTPEEGAVEDFYGAFREANTYEQFSQNMSPLFRGSKPLEEIARSAIQDFNSYPDFDTIAPEADFCIVDEDAVDKPSATPGLKTKMLASLIFKMALASTKLNETERYALAAKLIYHETDPSQHEELIQTIVMLCNTMRDHESTKSDNEHFGEQVEFEKLLRGAYAAEVPSMFSHLTAVASVASSAISRISNHAGSATAYAGDRALHGMIYFMQSPEIVELSIRAPSDPQEFADSFAQRRGRMLQLERNIMASNIQRGLWAATAYASSFLPGSSTSTEDSE